MPTPNKVRSDLLNLRDLLLQAGIATSGNPVVIERRKSVHRVTWQSAAADLILQDQDFASVAQYCNYVAGQAYSIMLFDGSLLQLSFDLTGDTIVGHRLSYHPCPFELDPALLLGLPLLDAVDLYRTAGIDYLRLRSPLRFDYSSANAAEGHPLSHLHMLWSHCRCAVIAPISLGHFVKFIFSNFYPSVWRTVDFLREWPSELGTKSITTSEEWALHIGCRRPDASLPGRR
jgi:hypothetical protein